jgi:hypothetical protein
MIYRSYTIKRVKSTQGVFNYTVKPPTGLVWLEEAANLATAKKWVDAHIIENRREVSPTFNVKENIGKAKYVVNYNDGVKTHKDGSLFFDIAIFASKRKKDQFVGQLCKQGFIEQ